MGCSCIKAAGNASSPGSDLSFESGRQLYPSVFQPREGVGESSPPTVQQQHAFLDAARSYDFARVRALVGQNRGYVNCQPAGRWSALHQAAHRGDVQTVQFLLAHGASPTSWTMDGRSPLDVADSPNSRVADILKSAMQSSADSERIVKPEKMAVCASEDTIAKLPVNTFQGGLEQNDDAQCQICLDDFSCGDKLHTLPCSHVFHAECVAEWLKEKSCSCPVCRHEFK